MVRNWEVEAPAETNRFFESVLSFMNHSPYNETFEARRFSRGASEFHTAEERLVFDAMQANFVRLKSRFGLRLPRQPDRWERELSAVENVLPLDHPVVATALADGETVFRERVAD